MNNIFFLVLLVILGFIKHNEVYGAGECGLSSPDKEARKLAPCISAAMNASAPVSDRCCYQIKTLGQKIACLCAIVLSNTAKIFGVKPEIAVTIPKRCNIADRPVGLQVWRLLSALKGVTMVVKEHFKICGADLLKNVNYNSLYIGGVLCYV